MLIQNGYLNLGKRALCELPTLFLEWLLANPEQFDMSESEIEQIAFELWLR